MKKYNYISILIDDELKKALEKKAKEEERKVADTARRLIIKALKGGN